MASQRFSPAVFEPLERRALLAATRIMPVGDSITEGLDGHATYRYWLWHQLKNAGRDVDFVGGARGVWQGMPRFPDFDQDHEGHVGYRADTLVNRIDEFAAAQRPDIVLLHIGSNDMFQAQSVDGTIAEVAQVIDKLRLANPRVIVLLAQLIPSVRAIDAIPKFNQRIPALAAAKNTNTSPVIVVDQYTGFSLENDTLDGVHPDESGERKLAERWMAALSRITAPPADPNPWLGDVPFLSARNGLGPVERNKSNGGAAAGDGRSIKFNGKTYRKGLGVHAMSDVRFSLGGRYALFTADLGLDDEVANQGSVIFRVYLDYVKVYDSGPVTGRTNTKSIQIDVSGVRNLRLVVTDKGDNTNDHADWADARLFSSVPVSNGVSGSGDGLLGSTDPTKRLWSDLEESQQRP